MNNDQKKSEELTKLDTSGKHYTIKHDAILSTDQKNYFDIEITSRLFSNSFRNEN